MTKGLFNSKLTLTLGLLWALVESELGTISQTTQNHFKDLRYEVSRLLRALVEDLPEPDLDEGSHNG